MRRLLLVAFFLEVGFLLLVVPWSAFWDRNYFAQAAPSLLPVVTNNFVRGAVSGLGLVNVYVGIMELVGMLTARRGHHSVHVSPTSPVESPVEK